MKNIFTYFAEGMTTPTEFHTALDKLSIRGGILDGVYTGYDYAKQKWLQFDFATRQFI